MKKTRHSSRCRGFTLSELAIVLGVIGIVLGAIWVAAAKVTQSNRLQSMVKNTAVIVQQYRSMFSRNGVDIADFTDITCQGVNAGYFPKDMLLASTVCAAQNYATYPQHPWNSYVQIFSHQSYQGVIVTFANLPQIVCNQLAQQLVAQPDVIYENVNGLAVNLPPVGNGVPLTEVQINDRCAANNSNILYIMFKAR